MNRLSDNHRTVFVCLFLAITTAAIYWQINHLSGVIVGECKYDKS